MSFSWFLFLALFRVEPLCAKPRLSWDVSRSLHCQCLIPDVFQLPSLSVGPFLSSLILFPGISLCFIYPAPQLLFVFTYVSGVTFSWFALVLLRSLSGTTRVCNLFVICLCACPYCNFTGLLLVCSSVFPGRVMPSLLASEFSSAFSFPFYCQRIFMWVSLIVYIIFFLSRKAFYFQNLVSILKRRLYLQISAQLSSNLLLNHFRFYLLNIGHPTWPDRRRNSRRNSVHKITRTLVNPHLLSGYCTVLKDKEPAEYIAVGLFYYVHGFLLQK